MVTNGFHSPAGIAAGFHGTYFLAASAAMWP
jgi:hypothetical protein